MRELDSKARLLRSLHDDLLAPLNARDVASAVVIAHAGARGRDDQRRGVVVARARGRAATEPRGDARSGAAHRRGRRRTGHADLESGYGRDPDDVAATVQGAVEAGAAGMNLGDSWQPGQPLFTAADQAKRRAARPRPSRASPTS